MESAKVIERPVKPTPVKVSWLVRSPSDIITEKYLVIR